MANWTRTLQMQPEYDQAKTSEITLQALAATIADRLDRLHPLADEDAEDTRQNLVEDFREMSRDAELDTDAFDDMMTNLYDWGDTRLDDHWNGKKVCWVNTLRAPVTA